MELQMTDVPGVAVGNGARDLKTGRAITGYDEWFALVKACMAITRVGIGTIAYVAHARIRRNVPSKSCATGIDGSLVHGPC